MVVSCIVQLPVFPKLTMKAEVHNANLRSVCHANRELSSRLILSLQPCYNLCVYARLSAVCHVHIPIEHRLFPHWHAVPRIFLIIVFIAYILFTSNRDNCTCLRVVIFARYISNWKPCYCETAWWNGVYQWITSHTHATSLFNSPLHSRDIQTSLHLTILCVAIYNIQNFYHYLV